MNKKYRIEITKRKGQPFLRYYALLKMWREENGGCWFSEEGAFGFTEDKAKKNVIRDYKEKLEEKRSKKTFNLDTL